MNKRTLAMLLLLVVIVGTLVACATPKPTPTPTYTLSVSVSPSGAGSVSPPGGKYESGLQVTLTATPASGYTFDYWGGAASGSSPTINIIMNSNKSTTAHFKVAKTTPAPTPTPTPAPATTPTTTPTQRAPRPTPTPTRITSKAGLESFLKANFSSVE